MTREQLERELSRLAERLEAPVRPGHVDYVSKSDAAKWLWEIVHKLHDTV